MTKTTEAQDDNRNDLIDSTEQLLKLLVLKAPAEIICGQAASIVVRTLLAYGELTFAKIGGTLREAKLIGQGFCMGCERRFDPTGLFANVNPHYCQSCREQFEWEDHDPSMN